MADFKDVWEKRPGPSRGGPTTGKPMKPQIQSGIVVLQKQKQSLGRIISKIESRDKHLLSRVAKAKDRQSAVVVANELAQLRKLEKMMHHMRLQLEKAELRLSMYSSLGDTAATLTPIIQTVKSMGTLLGKFVPGANEEIAEMAQSLGGFMMGMQSDAFTADQYTGEDTERIMQEAAAVATESVNSRFPSMPEAAGAAQAGGAQLYSGVKDTDRM